ncbi:MAG: hypothetical protein QOH68_196 [Nocardioidaceae bacterium]|jgi:hypothetical protein|nr:hypothetical protein [Nocardioidaceae bacterium]
MVPDSESKSLPQVLTELWELLKSYAKQETVDPFKQLGRFLKFGIPGAVLLAAGYILLLLAGLRALQTETDTTFTGHLSWVPYLITLVIGALAMGLSLAQINKKRKGATR